MKTLNSNVQMLFYSLLHCLLYVFNLNAEHLDYEKPINGIEKITFVSAFLSNINQRSDRSIEDYVEWSHYLLKSDIPKVIFIEYSLYNSYYEANDNAGLYPQTHFIYIDHNSLYLNTYRPLITNFNISTNNPKKDTLEYFLMVCNKTDWVNQAINLNIFDTDQYVWIDFGLFHVFKDSFEFEKALISLQQGNKTYKEIRIGGCWNLEDPPESKGINIYKNVAWYFAGGVFGGHKDSLVIFNQLVIEKCKEVIIQLNSLMWEVNIWYLVYLENKHLFNTYKCNHNRSILNNY